MIKRLSRKGVVQYPPIGQLGTGNGRELQAAVYYNRSEWITIRLAILIIEQYQRAAICVREMTKEEAKHRGALKQDRE